MLKPRSLFQQRHFEWLADFVSREAPRREDRRRLAKRLAKELSETNPNFKREKFLKACALDPSDYD
jgi:hypothetical protein